MSAQARYIPSRSKLGSPIVQDTEARRPVLVCMRDTDVDGQAADDAAMGMARICAQALNRVQAEEAWRKQQEKGR